ncbi:MAG: hypothetical protein ACAI25_05520 [Planctomycetota bacterium]
MRRLGDSECLRVLADDHVRLVAFVAEVTVRLLALLGERAVRLALACLGGLERLIGLRALEAKGLVGVPSLQLQGPESIGVGRSARACAGLIGVPPRIATILVRSATTPLQLGLAALLTPIEG